MKIYFSVHNHFTGSHMGMPVDLNDKRVISLLTGFLKDANYPASEINNIALVLRNEGLYEIGFFDKRHNQINVTLKAMNND